LARKTVRRALRADRPPGRQLPVGKPSTSPRETLIDAFKDDVKHYLEECADLSAVQIHRRLVRERQFRGSVYVVRRYVRTLRERKRRAYLHLAYLPGECAQVDWAHFGHTEIRGAKRRVSAFVMVMAYSRLLYVELTLSERMDAFLEAHDRAFRYFGGVPKKLLYDNCRTVVIQRAGRGRRFHPRLLEFADHYLFKVATCPPRRPWHKGIVESGIGYLRKSFRRGRGRLEDLETAREELRMWLDDVANVRTHRTTGESPRHLFASREAASLLPLPGHPHDTAHLELSASVDKFYRVAFDGNRYSVPFRLAHRKGLVLRATTAHVEVYADGERVACHLRSYGRGEDVYEGQHDQDLRKRLRRAHRSVTTDRFLQVLGPSAEPYATGLAQEHVRASRHLRKILRLVDRYGLAEVQAAMEHALRYEAFGAACAASGGTNRAREAPAEPDLPRPEAGLGRLS